MSYNQSVVLMVIKGLISLGRISKRKMEGRVKKLKNVNGTSKDLVIGKTIKNGDELVIYWILKLCNMGFESGGVPKD